MSVVQVIKIAVVAWFVAVACAVTGAVPASGQYDGLERTATLLPYLAQTVDQNRKGESLAGQDLAIAADERKNPTKLSFLRFSLAPLPAGARITGWTLRLRVKARADGTQLVRVFRPAPTPKAVGMQEIAAPAAGRVDFTLDIPATDWVDLDKRDVALMLQSVTPSLDSTFFPLCNPTDAPGCENTQPRLIVRYVMPPEAPAMDWPQARYDAQQSGRTRWQTLPGVRGAVYRQVYAPKGYIVGAPVLAQGNLIFHTQLDNVADSEKFFLTAVDGGGTWMWQVNISAAAKFPPVQGPGGRLFVVSEDHLVTVEPVGAQATRSPWSGILGPGTSVRARPTVGANGALYLSTNRGVVALGPDLRVWWRVGRQAAQFGQVALSADEATAYVADGATGTLVAIDNTDGTELWGKGALPKLRADVDPPTPVVATVDVTREGKPERRTLVYVVAGDDKGQWLAVFDGADGRTTGGTRAFLSRPVVASNGRAWVARRELAKDSKGVLCRYFWEPWEAGTSLTVRCDSRATEDLSPQSVLAMDGKDNVYVLDGTASPQKVRGYTKDFAPLLALDVQETRSSAQGKSTNFGDNVLVGPDGTLYATNSNALFAIEMTSFTLDVILDDKDQGTVSDLSVHLGAEGKNTSAFLARRAITVTGRVHIGSAQSLVLRAGDGPIVFARGFSVKKGARVLCRTGRLPQ